MAIGLRTFLKSLAHDEIAPFDTLYERQRELVRCGLLPTVEGRGPGSGVPLTPETLATFLIGLLATDSLADLGLATKGLCEARPLIVKGKAAGMRNSRRSFHTDLAKALIGSEIVGFQTGDDLSANLYAGMSVTRAWRGMLLQSHEVPGRRGTSLDALQGIEYLVSENARLESPLISHTASIEMEPWWTICLRLRGVLKR